MTKVIREASMTKVIQSFQSSDLQPLNARLLRGEVAPWEPFPLNNPPFHWARKTQLCQNSVSPRVLTTFPQKMGFSAAARAKPLMPPCGLWGARGASKIH